AEQRGACRDRVNRNARHQLLEAALSGERLHEPRFLKRTQYVQRNAARQVDAARRKNLQEQIAGFARENRGEDVDRLLAQRAWMVRVIGGTDDRLRSIFG